MHTIGFEDNDIRVEIKDGIMYNLYKNGVIIDKEVTSKMISERMKLSNGQSYPLISNASEAKYWTLSSRNNDMKAHAFELIDYAALVVPTSIGSSLWNFTIKLFPPPILIKVFYDVKQAEEWIISKRNKTLKEELI